MFRVHLTAADIARTRIAAPLEGLAEAVFSLDALQRSGHDPVLDGWRAQMGRRVRLDRWNRFVADLLPRAWELDLTALGAPGDDAHAEARAELQRWYRVAVAPYWTGIRALLEAQRRRLARLAGERGIEALLASLHPSMRWQAPVLHVASAAGGPATGPTGPTGLLAEGDCHLDGRGVAIVPSLFCPTTYPVCRDLARPEAPLVVYYPAIADPCLARQIWATGTRGTEASLVALLGRTRARVLQALGEGEGVCTTSDLAARAGVAVSSASEHATVLRRAGLVASRRDRSTVFHWLTPLGVGLLDGPSVRTRGR